MIKELVKNINQLGTSSVLPAFNQDVIIGTQSLNQEVLNIIQEVLKQGQEVKLFTTKTQEHHKLNLLISLLFPNYQENKTLKLTQYIFAVTGVISIATALYLLIFEKVLQGIDTPQLPYFLLSLAIGLISFMLFELLYRFQWAQQLVPNNFKVGFIKKNQLAAHDVIIIAGSVAYLKKGAEIKSLPIETPLNLKWISEARLMKWLYQD